MRRGVRGTARVDHARRTPLPRTATRVAITLALLAVATVAAAAAALPKPGTAKQVAALVAASSSIQKLPSDLLPALSQVPEDAPGAYYPVATHECDVLTKCVFGDVKSHTFAVLFGDSHAQMWLPALVPVFKLAGERLVLIWRPGCPDATVSVWEAYTKSINVACNTWRSKMIALIHKARPALVLLSDRTSDIPGAGNRNIPNATWQAGLEQTITELATKSTSVAVVGDVVALNEEPSQCLASYPTTVQKCSVPNPNPKTVPHFAAELAAATAKGVPYVTTQQWLCTSVCSPVIGSMVAYFDRYHVSATYSEYLARVWQLELQSLSLIPK